MRLSAAFLVILGAEERSSDVLRVLGPISIDGPDGRHQSLSRVQRQLLAALVAAGPSGISLDALADELWTSLPATWSASLRNHLARLRTALGSAELPTRGGVCRLDLPAPLVDAWLLLAPRTPSEWTDDLVWLLEPSTPYEDVEPTDRITQSANRIVAARRRILDALVIEGGEPLSVAMRDVMRSSAQADPFDEHLTMLSATADADAGEIARALATVEHNTSIVRHELGDAACRSLDALTDSLAGRHRPSATVHAVADDERHFPEQLSELAASCVVGRERQFDDAVEWLRTATSPRHLAIEGDWAAGKSQFLAQVAKALFDDGANLRFTSGSPSSLAYEGILAALPELRPALETLADRLAAPRVKTGNKPVSASRQIEQTVLWSRAADLIEQLAADRPLALVIDDLDQLDTPSAQLLAFLLRSQPAGTLTLVSAALVGQAPPSLIRSDTANRLAVRLQPLDLEAITSIVERQFAQAPADLTEGLARSAMQLSGGLPSLLRAVLDATDPVTLAPPADLRSPDDVITSLLVGLDDHDVTVGAAVAVLGQGVANQAKLSDIAAVAGRPIDEALESLDRLVEQRLLVDGPRPDAFRLPHSPAAVAFRDACSRSQLRSMHAAAAGLATNLHRRAHHLLAAMPSFDVAEVVTALEESARNYLDAGAVREAFDEFHRIQTLDENALTAASRGQMAACLSRLGRIDEADAERAAAFRQAADADDWEESLNIVLAGQHDDIVRIGQTSRLALVESIPMEQLSARSRGRAAVLTSILAHDLGRSELSARASDDAHRWIDDRDRHELARAEHLTRAFDHPADRLRRVRAALNRRGSGECGRLTDAQQLTASQLMMLDHYMLGETTEALGELDRFEALALKLESVRAQWHTRLVRSMLAMADDDRDQADRLSFDASRFAERYGLVGGDTAHLAQQFFGRWLDGTHGDLLPQLLQLPEPAMVGPARAAVAAALFAADRLDEAIKVARPLAEQLEQRSDSLGPTVAMSLAEVAAAAGEQGDTMLADIVTGVLEPLSGTIAILGVGIIDRGPVDASLALLAPRGSIRRAELLGAAGDLAQRTGSVLWQKRIVGLR